MSPGHECPSCDHKYCGRNLSVRCAKALAGPRARSMPRSALLLTSTTSIDFSNLDRDAVEKV
jgi:hypothetical protein